MMETITNIKEAIINDLENKEFTDKGWNPIFMASPKAKILIIGQAPGLKTQEKSEVFRDKSGDKLRDWLDVDEETFYYSELIAVLPLDFYFPGKAKTGDLPPRSSFFEKWHPKLIALMPDIELTILIGSYAQKFYLKDKAKRNLTETIKAYQEYLPKYFPIPHPSPLNFRWLNKNPDFEESILPNLKNRIKEILE